MIALCLSFLETESTEHYFLHCQIYLTFCTTFMNEQKSINDLLVHLYSNELVRTILYGDKKKKLIMTLIARY